jgi:hypothetical protein
MGKLFVLLLGLLWAQTDAAWASVFNAKVPGKWPAGQITWYYNPNGRPANLADAEVIAAVSTAFADWQRVCQITPVYGGTTDVPADPPAPSTYVVGWTDFGSPQFHAKGVRSRLGGTATYAPLTGGGIQINTANTDWRSLFDAGSAVGIFHHEIAHTVGLAHSDDPTSIMFANPYNTSSYELTLQGDDVAACADLYGGKGVFAKTDLRSAVPEPGFVAKVSVLSTKPGSATPTSSQAQIDPVAGGPYYFDRHWEGLPVGSLLEARWVTPNGSVYLRRTFTTTTSANGYRYTTFPDDVVPLPYAGRWAFQLLVDGRLAASTPFEVLRGTVTAVAPFEGAMVGEAGVDGALNWRAVSYGNGNVKRLAVIANNKATAGLAFRASTGDNVAEVWVETDRPRYKLDQDDGQPATSLDVMRTLRFVAGADGLPAKASVLVSETGTPDAYSATATVTATGTSLQGVYVVALVNGAAYFRRSGGWTDQPTPLVTVQAPAVASVDVLRNMDTREFPAGSALYVGFGSSVEELLARGQYALVRRY